MDNPLDPQKIIIQGVENEVAAMRRHADIVAEFRPKRRSLRRRSDEMTVLANLSDKADGTKGIVRRDVVANLLKVALSRRRENNAHS